MAGKADKANFAVENNGKLVSSGIQDNIILGIPTTGYYAVINIGDVTISSFGQIAISVNSDAMYFRHKHGTNIGTWQRISTA